jgi:hypothetical protein
MKLPFYRKKKNHHGRTLLCDGRLMMVVEPYLVGFALYLKFLQLRPVRNDEPAQRFRSGLNVQKF